MLIFASHRLRNRIIRMPEAAMAMMKDYYRCAAH
jgi:hypothetical protein